MGCCSKGVGTEADEKKTFDPKFRGPIEPSERRCRDVWMLLIFVVFWAGLFIVAFFGVSAGDPYRLLNGVDSFGNTCGRDNTGYKGDLTTVNAGLNLQNYGKLLDFNPLNKNALKLCVAACPAASIPYVTPETGYCLEGTPPAVASGSAAVGSGDAAADATLSTLTAEEIQAAAAAAAAAQAAIDAAKAAYEASGSGSGELAVQTNPYYTDAAQWTFAYNVNPANGCPSVKLRQSMTLMNRCVPAGEAVGGAINAVMEDINLGGIAQDFISDTQKAYVGLIIILGATLVVSIILVFLLRWFAYIMIWIIYWGLTLGSGGLIGFLWYMWYTKNDAYNIAVAGNVTLTSAAKSNVDMFLGLSIAWSILGGLFFILLLYMYNRIALVVALFTEAGKCIGKMPLILLYPVLTLISGSLCVAYFALISMYLFSAGVEVVDDASGHVTYAKDVNFHYMSLYHLFGFYWSWELTMAFQEAVLAGCAATWYFTRDKKDLSYTISKSVWRTIRYSMGSLIFGALIIAIIKFIRFLLSYFEKKCKSITERSSAAKFILKCVKCCLWCCEKCMKFINRNAYIEIAIYGKNFCRSAWSAFAILLRNALRVAAINSIGDLVLFFAKLIITAVGAVAAFAYFEYQEKIASALDSAGSSTTTVGTVLVDDVQYESLQIILITLLSYFVASMFVGVYEMLIDTIFICFAEDSERNDGTPNKPFFMSKNLLKFMASEEKRTQKRTEKEAQYQQKKAAAAQEQHDQAMGLNIDSSAGSE